MQTGSMYESDMLKIIFNQFVERNNQNRLKVPYIVIFQLLVL
jgi:hypothetical protein